jgi:hypothetical protein
MGLNRPQRPAIGNLHDALPNLVRPRVARTKPVHDHTTTKGPSGPLFRSRGVRMTAQTQPILNDAPTLVLFKRDEAGKAHASEKSCSVAGWSRTMRNDHVLGQSLFLDLVTEVIEKVLTNQQIALRGSSGD